MMAYFVLRNKSRLAHNFPVVHFAPPYILLTKVLQHSSKNALMGEMAGN